MSNVVMFYTHDDANYKKIDCASREIIEFCLKNKVGVLFNFLGYCDDLIAEINPNFYFMVSDDFIQLNSEFLTTSHIRNIGSPDGKKRFCKDFCFFDDIYKILKKLDFKKIGLVIITDNSCSLKDCKNKEIKSGQIVDCLYDTIIENKDIYAYDFPNLSIVFK